MPHLVTSVGRWAERSQQRACRNAMVASTALTKARAERDEVAAYVAGTLARRATPLEPTERERAAGA